MAFNKNIDLTLTDSDGESKELKFNMNAALYDQYTNSLGGGQKLVTASKKLLNGAVKNQSREELRKFLAMPGMALDLAAAVVDKYKPEFEIDVKISSDEQSESEEIALKA